MHKRTKSSTIAVITSVIVFGLLFISAPAHAQVFGIPDVSGDAAATVQQPTDFVVVTSKTKSVTVSWSSDVRGIMPSAVAQSSPAAVTSYVVKAFTKKNNNRVKTVRTLNTSVTIDGLTANKAYHIKVWAERGGVSSEPAVLTTRTLPAKAQSLTAQTKWQEAHMNRDGSSTAAQYLTELEWKAPRGTVKYYKVKVYKQGKKKVLQSHKVKKNKMTVSGLEQGQEYAYQVTVYFNKNYSSKKSKRKKFTV